jgi:hypothetical protein
MTIVLVQELFATYLVLPNTEEMRNRFGGDDGNEDIEDILFVITYSGRIPEWPN